MDFGEELVAKGFKLLDGEIANYCHHDSQDYTLYFQLRNFYYPCNGIIRSKNVPWCMKIGCEFCINAEMEMVDNQLLNFRLYYENKDITSKYNLSTELEPNKIINNKKLNDAYHAYEEKIKCSGKTIFISILGSCEFNDCSNIIYALYVLEGTKYHKYELCKNHLDNAFEKLVGVNFRIYNILSGV